VRQRLLRLVTETKFCSLMFYMQGEWKCNKCQRLYSSRATLSSHRCSTKPNPIYRCHVCKREFLRRSYLNRHMLLHLENHPCTVCGKKLHSGEALQNHQNYCRRVSNEYFNVLTCLFVGDFALCAGELLKKYKLQIFYESTIFTYCLRFLVQILAGSLAMLTDFSWPSQINALTVSASADSFES
jgi:hypothetical protein